ncbi:MAG TPA: hypothetical protein VMU41_14850, partial [Candidatus Binataceae bacterium]|nr:hypothetical protein [Candidatus Binataceae bacterium]
SFSVSISVVACFWLAPLVSLKFRAMVPGGSVGMESITPGLLFAFFDAFAAIWACYRVLPH